MDADEAPLPIFASSTGPKQAPIMINPLTVHGRVSFEWIAVAKAAQLRLAHELVRAQKVALTEDFHDKRRGVLRVHWGRRRRGG